MMACSNIAECSYFILVKSHLIWLWYLLFVIFTGMASYIAVGGTPLHGSYKVGQNFVHQGELNFTV